MAFLSFWSGLWSSLYEQAASSAQTAANRVWKWNGCWLGAGIFALCHGGILVFGYGLMLILYYFYFQDPAYREMGVFSEQALGGLLCTLFPFCAKTRPPVLSGGIGTAPQFTVTF